MKISDQLQTRTAAAINWPRVAKAANTAWRLSSVLIDLAEDQNESEAVVVVQTLLIELRHVLKALDFDNAAMKLDPILGDLERDLRAMKDNAE